MPFKRFERIRLAYFRYDDERIRTFQFARHVSERFSNQPFHTVSHHAFSVPFAYGDAHCQLVRGKINHGEGGGKSPFSLLKKLLKIRLFFQFEIFHCVPVKSDFLKDSVFLFV